MSSTACLLALTVLTVSFSGGRAIVGNGTECIRAPPNINRIALGVDISSLDLLPIDFADRNGYKMPIIDLTCDEGRVYHDKGLQYQLPDQIFRINKVPGGMLSAAVETYKTSTDIRNRFNTELSVGGTFKPFSFSTSASYSKLQESVLNEERYVSDTSSYHSSHKIELFPYYVLPMNPVAKLFLEQKIGRRTYSQVPKLYHRFIDLWGTHYFSSAQFGGQIRIVYSTSQDFLKTHTEEEIKITVKASFLSSSSTTTKKRSKSEEEFNKHSTNTVRYYGGNVNLIAAKGFAEWQPTVDDNPWLFTGALRPISELIQDEKHKSGIEQAALQHVMRDHFAELRRQIEAAQAKLGYTPYLQELEKRLSQMEHLGLGKLVEADVKQLSYDIDNSLIIPDWFTENTKLCYKWRAPLDAGQCDGQPLTCALPGEWTSDYRDDSDGRNGGCHMQWGIKTRGADDWFKDVEICYKWVAEDDIRQCSNVQSEELCAKVNDFTKEYIDDTDHHGGGCLMSWKLKVPESAPLWMRLTKLCFNWRPDGDAGQCGPAKSQNMCAEANSYTPFYRDDTDGRGGGCVMKWKLQLDL